MSKKTLIYMKGIKKNFGYINALNGCDFYVKEGEITAIVGDNGSGKSTLMKILNGNLKADKGMICIEDKEYSSISINQAINLGIQTVYQDLSLDNNKNCMENVFLGCEPTIGKFFIDKKRMKKETEQLLKKLNIKIDDLSATVGYLSGGQRQGVAIARALNKKSKILILDEPTAAMGIKETHKVMELLKEIKHNEKKITQILISHNLFQAFDIADSIHIIRSGKCIARINTKDSTPSEIHNLILEKEMEEKNEE